jgi:Protein of unknown function (DUF3306)
MADADNFFSRWSKRKVAVEQGAPLGEPVAVAVAVPVETIAPKTAPAPEAPPLTLADTVALTKDSDYAPFMAKAVSPEVKNAAMKKLFADPHFNVMDGLDTYIDDYSKPDPLPLSMLRQMASAKFLNLFDEEDEAKAPLSAPLTPEKTDDHADLRLQPNDAAAPPEQPFDHADGHTADGTQHAVPT